MWFIIDEHLFDKPILILCDYYVLVVLRYLAVYINLVSISLTPLLTSQVVETSDGRRIPYDKLCICSGAKPKVSRFLGK